MKVPAGAASGDRPPAQGPYDDRMSIDVRPAGPEDIAAVLLFWRDAAAPTTTDDADGVGALLGRDPGSLLVAESSGRIVGTVIAAWDGWRGCVYRIAVAPAYRREGLGRRLLDEAEDRLRRVGARRMHAIVVGTDPQAVGFWESSDWDLQDSQLRFTRG
jgi:ribosomal protein S18 acetylase RimI-like enzyme